MKKQEVQTKIGAYLTDFTTAKNATELANIINGVTNILRGLNYDNSQQPGINLLIQLIEKSFFDGAMERIKSNYSSEITYDIKVSVNYTIPELLNMAIWEE